MVDPITIGLIAGGASALLGGIKGAQQKKEAARRERLNAELSALDTAYAPLVKGTTQKLQEIDAGPGVLGGALGGGISGFQGGATLAGSINKMNAYGSLADQLKAKNVNPALAQRVLQAEPITAYGPMMGLDRRLG